MTQHTLRKDMDKITRTSVSVYQGRDMEQQVRQFTQWRLMWINPGVRQEWHSKSKDEFVTTNICILSQDLSDSKVWLYFLNCPLLVI